MVILWAIVDKFKLWLAMAGGAILAGAYIAQKFYRKGKEAESLKTRKELKKDVKKKRAIENDISNDSDDDLDDRLRDWVKD